MRRHDVEEAGVPGFDVNVYEDTKMIGYVSLAALDDKEDGKTIFVVTDLFVAENQRRSGVATELYDQAIKEARLRNGIVMSEPHMRSVDADRLHDKLRKIHWKTAKGGRRKGRGVDFYPNPPVSPEEKRTKREMEDLESQKMKIFFAARDSMFPMPPDATGLYRFPPEMIKTVEKAIKPQITEIDNRLRELRAEKKVLKAIKPVRTPKGPGKVAIHLGRCRDCDQKVRFLDRPGVHMDTPGPKQSWVGILCPKCGGQLGRTSSDGIKWDEVIDLDAR